MTLIKTHEEVERIRHVAQKCQFDDWKFQVFYRHLDGADGSAVIYLQLAFDAPCSTSGVSESWRSRKWMLSRYMTDSEVVQTCFKAVMTAMEHETREKFLYKGQPVFQPHFDVEALVKTLEAGKCSDARAPVPAP